MFQHYFPYLNTLHYWPFIPMFVSSFIHSAQIYSTRLCSGDWHSQILWPLPRVNSWSSGSRRQRCGWSIRRTHRKKHNLCWGYREGFTEEEEGFSFEEEEQVPPGGWEQLTEAGTAGEAWGSGTSVHVWNLEIQWGKDSPSPTVFNNILRSLNFSLGAVTFTGGR